MAANLDRLKAGLAAVVNGLLYRVDYLALYPAKVNAQAANGTLDVTPEDTRLPGMAGVPLRLGLPGCKATVQAGGRVLLGFEAGDPRRPVATIWDAATVTKLEVNATEVVFNAGTKEVARKDDGISAGTLSGTCPAGAVSFTHTPPGGPPSLPSLTATLTGKITEGVSGVKA